MSYGICSRGHYKIILDLCPHQNIVMPFTKLVRISS